MPVRVSIRFKVAGPAEVAVMQSLARSLTSRAEQVEVREGEEPGWLVAAFPLRTEPKYKALDRIEPVMDSLAGMRLDSCIQFPKTEAERARNRRKTLMRRLRRQEEQ